MHLTITHPLPTMPPNHIGPHSGLYWLCCLCHKLNGVHRTRCLWYACGHYRQQVQDCTCWVGRMYEVPDIRSNPDAAPEIQTVHPRKWWVVREERLRWWAEWLEAEMWRWWWGEEGRLWEERVRGG